jgi:arylsulfatase A-like enzyme
MLDSLERRGLLENTLVLVTSDHGMPFPRAKGQEYDFSNRVPLAAMWKKGLRNPGRTVDDYVSFIDLAPTFVELSGLSWAETGMAPAAGRSLLEIFRSESGGRVVPARDHVLVGKERHDVGRPSDWGYPIRGIVKEGWVYLHNFEISRWPAGNPETGYLNCDGGPTKTEILDARRRDPGDRCWALCFGKRPAEELYDTARDPDCLDNLAGKAEHRDRREALRKQLFDELKSQEDPRMLGQGGVFEAYPYAGAERGFYERFRKGEKLKAGWVNPSDFEPGPLD